MEIVGAIVHQLMKDATVEQIKIAGLGAAFTDHGRAVYPMSAAGNPFTAAYLQSKGDPIADLTEDLAAEQKARATYENLIALSDDPDVIDPLRFLREREIVHFQRFGEALRIVQDKLAEKKFFMQKPAGMNAEPVTGVSPTSFNMPQKGAGVSPASTEMPPQKGSGVSPASESKKY
jgi:spore coat protein JC